MNIIGSTIISLNETSSTNDYASYLLTNSKQPEGTIVLTEYQTKGKGQGHNSWYSDKNVNLLMSVILYPDFLKATQQFYLSMIISMGIVKTVEYFAEMDCKIKWPNDIFLNNKKIAGILIQNTLKGEMIVKSIAGIGLNINQKTFPKNISNASSLSIEKARSFDKKEVLDLLVKNLNYYYFKLMNCEFESLKIDFIQRLYRYNQLSKFSLLNDEEFEGTIIGVKDSGELIINIAGIEKSFIHGDIFFKL